jgi:hypothetical protein
VKDEMIRHRLVSADQVELKFPIPQLTHYDATGGTLTEITMNNPDRPVASIVLLVHGKFIMSPQPYFI